MKNTSVYAKCQDEWLVRLLISNGKITDAAAESLRAEGIPYASVELLRKKLLTKKDIAETVEKHYHVTFVEPTVSSIDKMALSLLPEKLCRKHMIIPLKIQGDKIELLMANPTNVAAQDEAGTISGRTPVPLFGLPDRIEELISQAHSPDAALYDLLKNIPEEESVEWIQDAEAEAANSNLQDSIKAPVIKLANMVIAQAVQMRASDIHIEQEEGSTVIRYRIDGDLRNMLKVPKHVGEGPLVSRIKIMSNLDIADHLRPQDGRAKLKVGTQEIGLRVSTLPTAFGEKVVLRILDQRQAEVRLEALGFRPETLDRIQKISAADQGLLLMTGPTGSGKTTTLYSLLHYRKSPDINIVTVEDPIEYRLVGINQTQVNDKAGLSFANVLRSVLRQDPDVVLVGEIRDRETADIAFQASLTGHLVFSTLHTNDSIATVNRLLDMGVERYKMAPALIGIIAQRLVRHLCNECKKEETPNPVVAGLLRNVGLPVRQFRSEGCQQCSFKGLSGRTTITELLDLREREARDMVNSETDMVAFRNKALSKNWLWTLQQDALWHLSNGDIPYDEAAAFLEPETSVTAAAPAAMPPASPAAQPQAPTLPQSSAGTSKGRRVLIVDDNADNRTVAHDTLEPEGYIITQADGGQQAIQQIKERVPDLVLLDIMMPQMDGFAVLKHLRQEMKLASLPIMILTAMTEAESQALALELGADDYLTKPFNPKILRARVRALFRRHEYTGR